MTRRTITASALASILLATLATMFPALAAEEPCPPRNKTGDVKKPTLLHEVPVEYTAAALDAGIEGVVILQTIIRADGTVMDIQALKELPLGLTDRAIDAVAQRRYQPATLCDQPVDVYFTIPVKFELPETSEGVEAEPPLRRASLDLRPATVLFFLVGAAVVATGLLGIAAGARRLFRAIASTD